MLDSCAVHLTSEDQGGERALERTVGWDLWKGHPREKLYKVCQNQFFKILEVNVLHQSKECLFKNTNEFQQELHSPEPLSPSKVLSKLRTQHL